ncbi:Arylsulfatase [Bremerella volcania]|uniref:Arylsulfatase n=1 Tax=Bremerella volcania TaxID=2527984 RepID=A0A518C1K2_9BACT|nr:arylsulfatase [Bremerella volcania]QDU73097.1 Arylsulfatase [Bremerella volcania]
MRRLVLLFAGLLLLVPSFACAAEDAKPNVIFIYVDDLGYGDLGCFGQQKIATPQLDQMASDGIKLTSFYAGCTVCRPSRLVLWTGRHLGHQPINDNKPYTMKSSDHTIAELMKEQGYTTGGVGKWAMGTPGSGGEPIYHGFDFWCGYLDQGEAHNYYPPHIWRCEGDKVEELPLPGNVLMDDKNARGRVAKLDTRKTYSHDVMTQEAFDFVRRNADKPFLLHIHWTIPHANNEGGRVTGNGSEIPSYGPYADKDWPDPEKGFAAMVTHMDSDVGKLRDLLKELKIEDNTLLIFTSDNGPHQEGGHKVDFFDSNGPLKGYKRTVYEGGIRVPFIAVWPGKIPAGTESGITFNAYDVMATYADLTQAKRVPLNDGLSFLPTLLSKQQKVVVENRKPDPKQRISYSSFAKMEAARQGPFKAVRQAPDKPIELYNLNEDIGETTDIAKDHPTIVQMMGNFMKEAKQPLE